MMPATELAAAARGKPSRILPINFTDMVKKFCASHYIAFYQWKIGKITFLRCPVAKSSRLVCRLWWWISSAQCGWWFFSSFFCWSEEPFYGRIHNDKDNATMTMTMMMTILVTMTMLARIAPQWQQQYSQMDNAVIDDRCDRKRWLCKTIRWWRDDAVTIIQL